MSKALPIIPEYRVFTPKDLEEDEKGNRPREDTSPCKDCPSRQRWNQRGQKCYLEPAKRYDQKGIEADEYDPVDLLVVADAPSTRDNAQGAFWSDDLGQALLKHVKSLGFKSFAVIPAVRCFPGGDVDHFILSKKYKGGSKFRKEPTALEVATSSVPHCAEYVRRALNDYAPKITLAMGPLATAALDMGTNIPQLRVKPIHPKRGLAKASPREGTVVTYDRFSASRSEWAMRTLRHDVGKVQSIATTGYATARGDDHTVVQHTLDTVKKVRQFVNWLLTADFPPDDLIAFDFETDNLLLSPTHNRLLNVGFARRHNEDESFIIPLAHPETPFSSEELAVVYKLLKKLFRSKGASWYGWLAHHAQFETAMVKLHFGVWLGEDGDKPVLDTEVFAYLLDENRKGPVDKPYNLENLASDYLGFRWYAEVGVKTRRDRLAQDRIDKVNEYVGYDAAVTARLFNTLIEWARKEGQPDESGHKGSDGDLLKLCAKLYGPATLYTSDLTLTGQNVNVDLLRKLRAPDSSIVHRLAEIEETFQKAPEVKKALAVLSKAAFGGAMPSKFGNRGATTFSLTSKEHRTALFWDVMKLDGAKESVDKKFQERYKNVPLVALFREYQGLSKLDTSYLEPIAKWLQSPNSLDGRLKPSFNLINTATGRLSASDPNSQQMPRGDTRDKKQIKALFQAALSRVLVQLDFSQAEVRWLGILSGDEAIAAKYKKALELEEELAHDPTNEKLLKALKVDGDIHMSTALTMYRLPWDLPFTDPKAAKDARQKAKTVCFGLIYGKIAKSLAADLGIPVEDAEEAVELWLGQFPQAAEWLAWVETLVENQGYVRSPFGRWRRLPEVNADDISVQNRAKRQSRNTPIQSAASDCCIYAACKLRAALNASDDPLLRECKLINTVHDSLVAEVPAVEDAVRKYALLAKSIFTDPNLLVQDFGIHITVPLAVDFDVGVNWGNMHDYKFTEKDLKRALYDAEVLRLQPAGTLFDDLKGKGLLYDEVHKAAVAA